MSTPCSTGAPGRRSSSDLAAREASGGHANGDTLLNIENVDGSDHDDVITGNEEDNALRGRDGDDTLDGREGGDILDGGDGEDTVLYRLSDTAVTIDLESGVANGGHATGDTLLFVEHVEGSDYGDVISGDEFDNTLKGHDGSDDLFGGDGDDVLQGGAGNDYLFGEDDDDTLKGGDNDDELDGGDGDDTLIGGAGADDLLGGEGEDTADYAGSSLGVTVDLNIGTGIGGDAQGDTLDDVEHVVGTKFQDTLTGDDGRNFLFGEKADDTLDGGAGWDLLDGGDGADRLIGGAGVDGLLGGDGNDTFVFGTGSGHDFVGDFKAGRGSDDVLELDGFKLNSLEDVQAVSYMDGADTIIGIDADTSITLVGVDLASLHQDDFQFI